MKKRSDKSKVPRVADRFSEVILDKPILEFGYPVAGDDDDDDDSDFSSLLSKSQKTPFSILASNLYNVDYNNRIIVIKDRIDEKCFVYAQMIENWNRYDKMGLDMKEKYLSILKNDNGAKSIFAPENDEEAENKAEKLIQDHPEIMDVINFISPYNLSETSLINFKSDPIRIKFNSPGGWLVAYQTLADVINLSKTKIIGINMGMAYSAAAFLLVACHERLALPKSRMMVHRGSGGIFGTYEQTENSQRNYSAEVNEMIESFIKRTKLTKKELNKRMNPDMYLSSKEALKYGLIDRIVDNIDDII